MINLEQEIWKDIKGYEGLYQVSNLGRVKSLERQVWNRFQMVNKPEKILKPRSNYKGYVVYALFNHNKRKDYKGHWLVLSMFKDNPENKPQINHINGIKDDNRLCNLEWCTNSENQIHAIKTGLRKIYRGKDNPTSKHVLQCDMDGNVIKEWECISDAIRFYGTTHIIDCCKGKRNFAKGFKWKYKEKE